jgi:glycosyltransferase involved in cell wall biosynthesis
MVHDHALYCMRGYKYNYFTRAICTRAFSPFCVFPCLASLGRNDAGGLPVKWVSYWHKKQEIALNKRCQRIIVYSNYCKQELVRNGFDADKIEICVPILPSTESSASFSQRNLILFAGQLIRGKGVDVLLRALAKVRTHYECAIFGDGSHRGACERLAAKLGIGQRVTFHGYVLPAALIEFYREASLFVMGSLWPEPFGMAGPEAMRYGLPVVAFDAGGIREWLTDGENGYLIAWKNIDLFAARLEQLLRDKALARRLGQCALETVQRYDCGRQIDRLECLMQGVVRASGPTLRFNSSQPTCSLYE